MSDAAALAVTAAKTGGEDQFIKARDRFRAVTQGALDEFQQTILNKTHIEGTEFIQAVAKLEGTCTFAKMELSQTLRRLTTIHGCGND